MKPDSVDAPSAVRSSTLRAKVIAMIAVIAIVGYALTRTSNAPAFEPSGDPVALPAAGKLTELSADDFEGVLVGLRGTPVIVNIWASWCAPCRTETPLLERTWRAHADDVMIIGVASKDAPSGAVAFMSEFDVGYPNVFDSSGQIRARMGLRGFPTTYVFGADGKLRTTVLGGLTEQRLAAILEDLRRVIDVGLLASMAILVIVPAAFVRPWPDSAAAAGFIDTSSGALIIGIVVGRLVAVAIDDPGSLTSLSDLIVVRSGVEFWPGAAAGVAWMAFRARRDEVAPARRLAAITAPGLVAWACFEATCLLRDGCPGPVSSIGLRPDGLVKRMVPVGLIVALAAAGAAIVLRRLHRRGMADLEVVTLAITAIAAVRSVSSIWLPHIGDDVTRQHQTSIAVLIAASTVFVVLRARVPRLQETAGS